MKYIVVIVTLVLCVSCSDSNTVKKLNYPIEKVQDVMIDLYIASEAVKDVSEIKKDSLLSIYKSQIEQIHQVEFAKVESDIKMIRTDPSLYVDVHGVVNDSLNSKEKAYQKIPSLDKRYKKDAIPSGKTKLKTKTKSQNKAK